MTDWTVHHGDCLEVLRTLPDCIVDAVVTDPPYGLSFMGRKWDYDVPSVDVWSECLRVLKPGGHLLAFAGTRTQHRMCCRIEDAGFEIRDMIAWVYGSGFPKSLDVSKAIDKADGAEREALGIDPVRFARLKNQLAGSVSTGEQWKHGGRDVTITAPATDAARQWQGWGTALKPALEPITVARKPLDGTVAENVLEWGTGAINVDGCRVDTGEPWKRSTPYKDDIRGGSLHAAKRESIYEVGPQRGSDSGRWPANLIHDGSEEVVEVFPEVGGGKFAQSGYRVGGKSKHSVGINGTKNAPDKYGDTGSAARFFYCSKASKSDRDEGLDGMPKDVVRVTNTGHTGNPSAKNGERTFRPRANHHPTVKPTDLMRYLCRLVTPPGGVVLDPFAGSGSTGKAAVMEGFGFIGIEREAEYVEIARARIAATQPPILAGVCQ